MDARYNEERYISGKPIFGSAAPELDISAPEVEERPNERVSIRSKTKAVNRQGISLFAVAGWACVAVLAVALLMSYIELNTLSNQSYELSSELTELQAEEARLVIEYESTFRLDEVEEYAVNMLGMTRADSDQIKYLDNRTEDKAVVLDGNGAASGLGAKLKSLLTTIAEYFK